ncbi:MAG: hypothetical protein JOZ29_12440 [Deltaproteobacteria bacterium]|nr:hypothetical protein [Deltaproteobacteria bacterium]
MFAKLEAVLAVGFRDVLCYPKGLPCIGKYQHLDLAQEGQDSHERRRRAPSELAVEVRTLRLQYLRDRLC